MLCVWQSVPWYERIWRAAVEQVRKFPAYLLLAWEEYYDE